MPHGFLMGRLSALQIFSWALCTLQMSCSISKGAIGDESVNFSGMVYNLSQKIVQLFEDSLCQVV